MNVPSYFLIVLGGFGIVWSYRAVKYRGAVRPILSEFEYAAFSAIWGSAYLYVAISILVGQALMSQAQLDEFYKMPFIVTPLLFIVGVVLGAVVGVMPILMKTSWSWIKKL